MFDKGEEGSAAFGAQGRHARADIHPVVPHGFQTQAGPGLASVPAGGEEYGEAEKMLRMWAGELEGTSATVQVGSLSIAHCCLQDSGTECITAAAFCRVVRSTVG